DIAAVIVNHNVRDLVLGCLTSLGPARAAGDITSVVVVDSGSSDDSVAAIQAQFPEVTVVATANLGYGAAVNLGIAATVEPLVLALNPDTELHPDAVVRLRTAMCQHPYAGIAGPRLLYPDGAEQPSRRRFPTRLTPLFESTTLGRAWPDNPWARRFYLHDVEAHGVQYVDWVVGACLLLRRSAVDQCGGFDPEFFLYSEEVELSYRFRKHGWRTLWVPDALVVHHEGASSSGDSLKRQRRFDYGRVLLAERMYGKRTASGLRVTLRAGYAAELLLETLKWLVGHRRGLRQERIAKYSTLLRHGIRGELA
ncbi:MAG: hypothetical protein DCC58_09210, partial [Chloroflexi bacterium]